VNQTCIKGTSGSDRKTFQFSSLKLAAYELQLLILTDIVSSSRMPGFSIMELRVEFGWT
jgi:hypothetical protein